MLSISRIMAIDREHTEIKHMQSTRLFFISKVCVFIRSNGVIENSLKWKTCRTWLTRLRIKWYMYIYIYFLFLLNTSFFSFNYQLWKKIERYVQVCACVRTHSIAWHRHGNKVKIAETVPGIKPKNLHKTVNMAIKSLCNYLQLTDSHTKLLSSEFMCSLTLTIPDYGQLNCV